MKLWMKFLKKGNILISDRNYNRDIFSLDNRKNKKIRKFNNKE